MADRDSAPRTEDGDAAGSPDSSAALPVGLDRRRWLVASLAVLLLVGAAAVALVATHDEQPAPIRRNGAVADLLGWIPATDETRRAFSVWSGDADAGPGTPAIDSPLDPLVDQLALTPMALTLGRSSGWRDRFGYGARDVDRWATAGADSSLAILGGSFDRAAIERALTEAGFRRMTYRGVPLYVLHDVATPSVVVESDAAGAANVIALYAGRLITASSPDVVRGAIDAAQGRVPSLADDAAIAAVVSRFAPLNGLVVVDAADHAVACGLGAGWTARDLDRPSGRYIAVGYGRLGPEGQRRTLVATSFGDAGMAEAASIAYEAGWNDGIVYAGGAGAHISAFARINVVSQTDRLLVAELVDGREAGWVRAAIRYAAPVCEAATTALPPGTPVPPPLPESSTGFRRVVDSPGDIGTDAVFLLADLAAIAEARANLLPEGRLDRGEAQMWLDAVAPLPVFTIIPRQADALVLWTDTFGIPLDRIVAVGEIRPGDGQDVVAVLVGTWDPRTVAGTLRGLGYGSVELDPATVFAFGGDPADGTGPVNQAGGAIWHNVGVVGDRIFLSTSSRSLRQAIDAATGDAPFPTGAAGFRDRLLLTTPNAVAAEIVGARAAARACVSGSVNAHMPDWLGLAAIWSVDAASIAVYPDAGASLSAIGGDLDDRISDAAVPSDPDPDGELPLARAFGYTGMERHDLAGDRSVAVARFDVPPSSDVAGFFAATVEN